MDRRPRWDRRDEARSWPSLPPDPVVFAVVAGRAPEGAELAVDQHRRDRAGAPLREARGVAHVAQLLADESGRGLVQLDVAGLGAMVVERGAHLEAVEARRFDGLLRSHAELDHIEEELQQV